MNNINLKKIYLDFLKYVSLTIITISGIMVLFSSCTCGHKSGIRELFKDKLAEEALYVKQEMGEAVEFIVDDPLREIGYCRFGSFSVDPHAWQNRIYPQDLPTTPVDLQTALHVQPETPPLKVIYYVGDVLYLLDSPELEMKLNDEVTIKFCLNNPGLIMSPSETSSNTYRFTDVLSGQSATMPAIEKDLYDNSNQLQQHEPEIQKLKASGTILVAKKIVIAGTVNTEGYDLIIVTDELEFRNNGCIKTIPVERPVGYLTVTNSGGDEVPVYDYGFKKEGYRGGDVVIMANRLTGQVDIQTTGGKGQRERNNFDLDVSQLKWKYILQEFEPPASYLESTTIVKHTDPDFRFFIEHHVFDVGEQGRGGRGGHGGNITIITPESTPPNVNHSMLGGLGAEPARTLPKIGNDPDLQQDPGLTFSDSPIVYDPPQIGPWPWRATSMLVPLAMAICGTKLVQASNPAPHNNCNLAGIGLGSCEKCYCSHVHTQRNNIQEHFPPEDAPTTQEEDGYVEFGNGFLPSEITTDLSELITCDKSEWLKCDEDFGVSRIGDFWVFGKRGPKGIEAEYHLWPVNAPIELLTFDESDEGYARSIPAKSGPAVISSNDYAQLKYAVAPKTGELMTLKADYLYRNLSDLNLLEKDNTYIANTDLNPLGINRLNKAQFYYASAAYLCVEAFHTIDGYDNREENPYWEDSYYAILQREKIQSGLNYFGFKPGMYVYLNPTIISEYLMLMHTLVIEMGNRYSDRLTDYQQAVLTGFNIDLDASSQGFEVARLTEEKLLTEEQAGALAHQIELSLERIDENNQRITLTQNQIDNTIQAIEELSQPPECDVLCWAGKIFDVALSIGKIVADVFSFNWGSAFSSLGTAFDALETASDFIDGINAVGEYASLLINGKTGTVKFDSRIDADCDVDEDVYVCEVFDDPEAQIVVEDDVFKKEVIDPAEDIYKNAKQLIDGITDLEAIGNNPAAAKIASIKAKSDQMSENLRSNLSEIYLLQSALADNASALAQAKTLEILALDIQNFNMQTPEFQRLHVEKAVEMVVLDAKRKFNDNAIDRALRLRDLYNIILQRNYESEVRGEVMLNAACKNARMINDRYLMLRYLYQRALAYLYLSGPSDEDLNADLLDPESFNNIIVNENTNNILNEFVINHLHPEVQPRVVTDIWSPAKYQVNTTVDANGTHYDFTLRTPEEINELLCPGTIEPCQLTKEAYLAEKFETLRNNGSMSIEIIPESRADFRSLPDAVKQAWNIGFSEADAQFNRKRVLDVSARLLMDNWHLPDPSIVSSIDITHDANATFRMDDGILQDFYFSNTDIQSVCTGIEAITATPLGCPNIKFFYRNVNAPFTEILTTYQDLSSITVENLRSNSMFGTSLRGHWEIDISSILNALETFQQAHPDYNGGTLEQPCTAVEEFWQKFRGIEFKVFWIPISY